MSLSHRFLGRILSHRTMMWEFADGSGIPLPDELRAQMLADATNPIGGTIIALNRKWQFEDAMAKTK